jgi:hypothetical protein
MIILAGWACSRKTKPAPGKTTRIEHPAPDQPAIDSLKEIRGKDKK